MPGVISHSPAKVIQELFIQLGLGSRPTTPPGLWPLYYTNEPNSPDNCLTIYNTAAVQFGRTMPDSERQEHYGVQVRVRASTNPLGSAKAWEIAVAMDDQVKHNFVTIDGIDYCIWSITRKGSVMDLGKDVPRTKLFLFTINATSYIRALN